ncbi:MAG: glutathione S-transferase family protein [Candidatus Binataceae bacterium]
MTVELYVFPPSPRAFKVLAVANHLGIDYTVRLVDLRKGDHRAPGYAALNPNMKMPTLKDGDFVLWESNAIIQYLADLAPEKGLMPADAKGRANVARWQFWESAHWDATCAVFVFENLVKPMLMGGTPDPAALKKAEEPFQRFATVLNTELRGKRYILGDKLSLADFSLAAPLTLAEAAHIPIAPYEEVQRWFKEMAALPAWQKTEKMKAQPAAA